MEVVELKSEELVPSLGDAFGEALSQWWRQKGRVYELVERDDGAIFVSDIAHYFDSFDDWEAPEQLICKHAKGRVLDVGCGAGRHSLYLQEMGMRVLAIEPSPGAAAVARSRGIEVLEQPLSDLGPSKKFDSILLGGQNLGLLESRERAPDVFNRLAAVASPGAVLLGVGIDPRFLTSSTNIRYMERNVSRGLMPGQQRLRIRHGAAATAWFDYLFASPEELGRLADSTPWTLQSSEGFGPNFFACFTLSD
ncbi:class I SAM-dependent methyltransferase [Streptomyces virginiae]|uniref:class I SAM-dependent methyltransferase n=1 Tax=Streptomyces virginiae TaxID=1961 RepID=UPI0036991271